MHTEGSYREVLKVPGVQPFLWLQFFNAFNDNMYKIVVSLLAVAFSDKRTAETIWNWPASSSLRRF